jgi:acetate kinase
MGYTPLDGIMMGTRPGAIDPGILLAIARAGDPVASISDGLEHGSGLAGVSGTTGDVRQLERDADEGDPDARLALDMFVARAAAGIAGAGTWLPRLDALVFTGGIGEHSGRIRAAIVQRLATLGIPEISDDESAEDRVLAPGPPAVVRVEAREDLVMAAAASALLRLP